MGFFNNKKTIPNPALPAVSVPVKKEQPVAFEIDANAAMPGPIEGQNPRPEVPGEETYEQWEEPEVTEQQEMYEIPKPQIEKPVLKAVPINRFDTIQQEISQQQQIKPIATLSELSDEEYIERMEQKISERKENIRLKKEEEERQRQLAEEANQFQPSQFSQQPVYLSEAELLREINRKVDALVMWAANITQAKK